MAGRSKTTASTDTKIVDAVENTEIKDEVKTVEKAEKETETKGKKKEIKDDDIVKICCPNLAGRSVIGIDPKPIQFDENGFAEVNGIEAKRFLTIPGYSLAK